MEGSESQKTWHALLSFCVLVHNSGSSLSSLSSEFLYVSLCPIFLQDLVPASLRTWEDRATKSATCKIVEIVGVICVVLVCPCCVLQTCDMRGAICQWTASQWRHGSCSDVIEFNSRGCKTWGSPPFFPPLLLCPGKPFSPVFYGL